jgi:CheY-like chemotaxis protein
MKVLVIDDDRAFLGMLRSVLTEEGHGVLAATDGRAGLELARQSPPDVILLDVLMPGMDGPAFARAYAHLPGRHAPIVVLTGASPAAAGRIDTAAAFLAKPFELDQLVGVLRAVAPQG